MLNYIVMQMSATNREKGYYLVLERTPILLKEPCTIYSLVSSFFDCFLAELNTTRTMDDARSLA